MTGRRRLLSGIGWLSTLLVVVWAAQLFVLPWIVTREVRSALAGLGLGATTFDVTRVSLFSAEVTKLSTGDDEAAAIAAVSVRYHPPRVLTGKLDVLEVVGGQVRIRVVNGKLDLGPLTHLTSSDSGSASSDLPFDRLELLSCSLLLEIDTEKIYMPVSGTLLNKGAGRMDFNIKTNAKGADVRLTGAVGGTQRPTLRIDAPGVSAADVSRVLRHAKIIPEDFPIRAVGPLDATFRKGDAGWLADVSSNNLFVGGRVGATPIAVEKVDGRITLSLDDAFKPTSVDFTCNAGQFTSGTNVATGIRVASVVSLGRASLDVSADRVSNAGMWAQHFSCATRWNWSKLPDGALAATLDPSSRVQLQDVHVNAIELDKRDPAKPFGSITPAGRATRVELDALGNVLVRGAFAWTLSALGVKSNALTAQTDVITGALDVDATGQKAKAIISIDTTDVTTSLGSVTRLRGATAAYWNESKPDFPTLECDRVTVGGQTLAGFTVRSALNDTSLDAVVAWPITPSLKLGIDANVNFDAPAPVATVNVKIPRTAISDPAELRKTFAALGGIDVTGTFEGSAAWDLTAAGGGTPVATLVIEGAKVASTEYDLAVDGIDSKIVLSDLSSLVSPGGQTIRVKSGRVGKLNVVDASVDFRLDGRRSVFVEKTSWGFAGGHLSTHAVRFDPMGKKIDLVVYGEGLSVDELLKISTDGKSKGEGTLYGMLPVKVDWPALSFGEGYLYGSPGRGVMTLGETASLVTPALDAQAGEAGLSAGVKQRAVAALKDFQYDLFRADFKNVDQRGMLATVQIQGRGRTGDRPQELDLTINVSGIDEALQNVLVVKRLLSGSN